MAKKEITPEGEIRNAESSMGSIELPLWKTPYNHDRNTESDRTAIANHEPTKTQQHQAKEADINTIVKNFGITGLLPQVNLPPTYEDFSNAETYQDMQNVIAAANSSFYGLPADIRIKFQNNPGIYNTYVNEALDNGDLKALQEMGLELKEKVGEPTKLGVAAPPPPEPPKQP